MKIAPAAYVRVRRACIPRACLLSRIPAPAFVSRGRVHGSRSETTSRVESNQSVHRPVYEDVETKHTFSRRPYNQRVPLSQSPRESAGKSEWNGSNGDGESRWMPALMVFTAKVPRPWMNGSWEAVVANTSRHTENIARDTHTRDTELRNHDPVDRLRDISPPLC